MDLIDTHLTDIWGSVLNNGYVDEKKVKKPYITDTFMPWVSITNDFIPWKWTYNKNTTEALQMLCAINVKKQYAWNYFSRWGKIAITKMLSRVSLTKTLLKYHGVEKR